MAANKGGRAARGTRQERGRRGRRTDRKKGKRMYTNRVDGGEEEEREPPLL